MKISVRKKTHCTFFKILFSLLFYLINMVKSEHFFHVDKPEVSTNMC